LSNVIKSFQINQNKTVQLFDKNEQEKDQSENKDEKKRDNNISKEEKDEFKKDKSEIISEAKQEAENLIEEARREAEEIKKTTQQEVEKAKEEAYQTGLEQGREEGIDKGWQEVENLIDRLSGCIVRVDQAIEDKLNNLDEEVLELSSWIAEKIIKRELSLDKTIINDLVMRALEMLNGEKEITIRVNSSDLKLVRDNKDEFLKLGSNLDRIKLMLDSEIQVGGCIVETDFGGLDATVKSQLEEISKKILEVNNDGQ
jgi:flagellar biosynthesis/type III secretory pathway protein FliH